MKIKRKKKHKFHHWVFSFAYQFHLNHCQIRICYVLFLYDLTCIPFQIYLQKETPSTFKSKNKLFQGVLPVTALQFVFFLLTNTNLAHLAKNDFILSAGNIFFI